MHLTMSIAKVKDVCVGMSEKYNENVCVCVCVFF